MKKIAIIYGSTTGNTEQVASMIEEKLDGDITVSNVTDATDEMVKEADLILYGSSTWGYGDLQDDFDDYYQGMTSDLLSGKDVAVFGCGDEESFEDVFCKATDLIREKAEECGANIVCDNLRVNGDPDDNEDIINEFITKL
jgi:flavodoxin I